MIIIMYPNKLHNFHFKKDFQRTKKRANKTTMNMKLKNQTHWLGMNIVSLKKIHFTKKKNNKVCISIYFFFLISFSLFLLFSFQAKNFEGKKKI